MKLLHKHPIPNSYRLNAIAEILVLPETKDDLIKIYEEFGDRNPVIIGRGNNIILTRPYYDESYVFVLLRDNFASYRVAGTQITALAGMDMKFLSMVAMCRSLSGLEHFFGLPSSLGGAVYMNAGAYDFETSQIVEKVVFFDTDKRKFTEYRNEDCGFAYRKSVFQQLNGIITEVVLRLQPADASVIYEKMTDLYGRRLAKQPLDYPSAGSVFKRPKGYYVGQMIEELGLKGFSYGGAKISEKHAGFIINYRHATAHDILTLIDIVRHKVKDKYGVWLETEQVVI